MESPLLCPLLLQAPFGVCCPPPPTPPAGGDLGHGLRIQTTPDFLTQATARSSGTLTGLLLGLDEVLVPPTSPRPGHEEEANSDIEFWVLVVTLYPL